jgi:hypothetical protein
VKYVRTTTGVDFRDHTAEEDMPEGIYYESNRVSAGFVCRVVIELDHGDVIIQSVKYQNWMAEVNPHCIEEIPAMEFLAMVHAGEIPDEALEKSPCE